MEQSEKQGIQQRMAESFESKIVKIAGEDNFKQGKQLLKNNCLICAYRSAKGRLNAAFRDKKDRIDHVEVANKTNSASCSCSKCSDTQICEHAVATILYFSRFPANAVRPDAQDEPGKYRGLKYEGFTELARQSLNAPEAELLLTAESAFPHVPSKFEHALIGAKLRVGTREYIGNLNNIRQLHFGKSLAASLKIEQFSQQDRQIIRFLAINAEPDSSKLTLDAEQTAELFHCLSGFDNFTQGGRKVIIHRNTAEPVMLYTPTPKGCLLRSALIIDGAILPLKSAKVITGRAGCWTGMSGEYWWVPATVDVSWLRSFLRTSEQDCNTDASKLLLNEKDNLPVKLIRLENGTLENKECFTLYNAVLTQDKALELQLSFDYDGAYYPPDESAFGCSKGSFWKRNQEEEKAVVDELIRFGFRQVKPLTGKTVFVLDDPEAVGVFADKLIPEWQKSLRLHYLSGQLAALSAGGRGVPQINLQCQVVKTNPKSYQLEYFLKYDRARFLWKDIYQVAKNNHHYHMFAGRIFKISKELRKFMLAAANIIHPVNGEKFLFQIPRSSVPFWVSAGKNIPGAVPPEFYAFSELLNHPEIIEAPKPDNKSFKINATLRDYQLHGVEWMKSLSDRGFNFILADEMGLGKTLQTLTLLAERLNKKSSPALVICPTSLVENWLREATKFTPSFKTMAIRGAKRGELWGQAMSQNLVITSYSIIKRDIHLLEKMDFSYVILDEAQHIKNPSTANAKTCKAITAGHKIVLTGTPLENSPEDLWSIFDFLHPDMLGSHNSFKNYYGDLSGDREKQNNLAARVAPFILRRKKLDVCTELPPKQEQILYCEMDSAQRKLYEQIADMGRKEFRRLAALNGKSATNMEILTILMRMRQICCHPLLLPKELNTSVSDSSKMDLMKELVLENIDSGHKMLLFSQFTSLLSLIKNWLKEENISFEYLDGSTKDRLDRVDNFNNSPDIPLFLLSLKAGGTGLNLTSADTVIIFDPWWNPAAEAQATDRTHRIGQLNPVTSVKLVVKDTVEEKILALQDKKAAIFQSLLENPEASTGKLSVEDLEFLFE
ncbi:MAG: DEAD/DEAH box helicase [Victivallales bacterium]|nr:DEAD/DEAH box helicase [Victivallales bacterium]